jgi:hypothetical protein
MLPPRLKCLPNLSLTSPRSAWSGGRGFETGLLQTLQGNLRFLLLQRQEEEKHGLYDSIDDVTVLKLDNLETFGGLIRARNVIDYSRMLAKFWGNDHDRPWDQGVGKWLDELVFPLAKDATPSNTEVSI